MKCSFCGKNVNGSKCSVCGARVPLSKENNNNEETETLQINEPTLTKKAINFSKSAVKHAASGFKSVDEKTQQNRMDICKKCEYYEEANNSCKKCGCFLQIKTSWASEACPEGKWAAEEMKSKGGIILPRVSSQVKTCGGCDGKKT